MCAPRRRGAPAGTRGPNRGFPRAQDAAARGFRTAAVGNRGRPQDGSQGARGARAPEDAFRREKAVGACARGGGRARNRAAGGVHVRPAARAWQGRRRRRRGAGSRAQGGRALNVCSCGNRRAEEGWAGRRAWYDVVDGAPAARCGPERGLRGLNPSEHRSGGPEDSCCPANEHGTARSSGGVSATCEGAAAPVVPVARTGLPVAPYLRSVPDSPGGDHAPQNACGTGSPGLHVVRAALSGHPRPFRRRRGGNPEATEAARA